MSLYRLLVIEDNEGDKVLLQEALAEASVVYDMLCITDGENALRYVNNIGRTPGQEPPHLVLLDLNLPKVSGVSILQAISENAAMADVPVIVMTSSSSPKDRDLVSTYRCALHIVKPTELDEFLRIGEVIRDVLAQSATASA